jgi:hypothetical protein
LTRDQSLRDISLHGSVLDETPGSVLSETQHCKLNNVDPQRYFSDVLTRLVNGWPQSRIDELMPWHWATAKNR